jgi:glycosyltransferase involved in cell wall biosynthesis
MQPETTTLSVVIPAYNEAQTIRQVIERVRNCGIDCEIIVVDDGSRDGTRELLQSMAADPRLKIVMHQGNRGKGAALKTGFEQASGQFVVIQDADLEYDPRDFEKLLVVLTDGEADIVYGSRFSVTEQRVSPAWHQAGNQLITWLSNLATGLRLSDVETCYKMFRRSLLEKIPPLLERGFGIELEMTAKFARIPGIRFAERPIRYAHRTYAEGKKIGIKDGFRALWCILRY